jgi:hypothetical protein
MKTNFSIKRIIASKIRRVYCKLAISKKNRKSAEWSEFEKKFIMMLKRAVLSKDATLYLSWTDHARVVNNPTNRLTIVLRGNSVKVHDEKSFISFTVPLDVQDNLAYIFDRAAENKSRQIQESVDNMMMAQLREVELGIDRRNVDFSKAETRIKRFSSRRIPITNISKEYLQGANH